MNKLIKCCEMCETWNGAEHDYSECKKCPALLISKENEKLKREVQRLKNEVSYMQSPLTIGGRHEMGG